MIISLLEPNPGCLDVRDRLKKWFESSRFLLNQVNVRTGPIVPKRFKGGQIQILGVRLKKPKPYFGNGPFANNDPMKRRGWNRKADPVVAKLSFLEGLDWIEFNDELNNFCDHFFLRADIASARCVIRRGQLRRVRYESTQIMGHHNIWRVRSGPEGYICSCESPIVPFSTTNGEPSGFYKMLNRHA
jgi:hypothetical protein